MIETIKKNYTRICMEIKKTCIRANRNPENIKIIAITKGRSYKFIDQVVKLGIKDIGENRVQEAIEKFSLINKDIIKHFIGHLQKNKVNKALENFDIIESIDSFELIDKVDNYLLKSKKIMKYPILIQVNISEEIQKTGIDIKEAENLINYAKRKENIKLCGLMGISGLGANKKEIHKQFKLLNKLKEKFYLKDLSIGMSNDYNIAVEEGSTMIRIGTELFKDINE